MDDEAALRSPGRRGGQMESPRPIAKQAPNPSRGKVARNGRSRGEHRRATGAVPSQRLVPDHIYAAVDTPQPSRLRCLRYGALRVPQLGELTRRNNAVLTRRKLEKRPMPSLTLPLVAHRATKDKVKGVLPLSR